MACAEDVDVTFASQVEGAIRALLVKSGMKPVVADAIHVTVAEPRKEALLRSSGSVREAREGLLSRYEVSIVPESAIRSILISDEGYARELAEPLRSLQAHAQRRTVGFELASEGANAGNLLLNAEGQDARKRIGLSINAALHDNGIHDKDITKLYPGRELAT